MQTLRQGNNIVELRRSRNSPKNQASTLHSWFFVTPQQVTLRGMLLTSSFNMQNAHQHLSVNFLVKSFMNGQQAAFVQVFPQRGNIMRGQIKKIRVKLSKQFKPDLHGQGSMCLKVLINLNTSYNQQYMKANRLSGWDLIKSLPIEQYEIPVLISEQYREIKQNIRRSVMFQSEFNKVSQDLSSFYAQENLQIPGLNPKNNFVKYRQKPHYSQLKPLESRRSSGYSQKKKLNQIPRRNQVFFGNQAKVSQSKIQFQNKMNESRRSVSQNYRSPKNLVQLNTIKNVKGFKSSDNFIPEGNLPLRNFQDKKQPGTHMYNNRNVLQNPDDSSASILRSLQGKDYRSDNLIQQSPSNYYRDGKENSQSLIRDYQTVKCFDNPTHANKRSIELVVLAVIAGFFVALGSNFYKLFH